MTEQEGTVHVYLMEANSRRIGRVILSAFCSPIHIRYYLQ